MKKEFKMSQARYDELQKELNYMKTTRSDEVAEMIKVARGFGDLSENSEYDEAKNEQGKLYSRIAELEEILLQDPDHIFLTTMGSEEAAKAYIGDLFLQDGWNRLTAVQNGQYTFLPKELFHFKPNARWAEAYEILAQTLYPELIIHD